MQNNYTSWLKLSVAILYIRGAQPICAKGRSLLFSVHSRAGDKIMSWIFKSRV